MSNFTEHCDQLASLRACTSYINMVSELCTIIVHSRFTSEVRNEATKKQRSRLYLNYTSKVQRNTAAMNQSHNTAVSDTHKHPSSTLCLPWTCKPENVHGVSQAEGLKCGTLYALLTFASFLHTVIQRIMADQLANSVKSHLYENPQDNPSSSEKERHHRSDL